MERGMRGFWHARNWTIDGNALLLPNGWRIPLSHIRQWRLDLIEGRFDLTGKWSGWRIRQHWLIPPGATLRSARITPDYLWASLQWDNRREVSRRQLGLFD